MVETATETSCKSRTSSPATDDPPRKNIDPKKTNPEKDDYMDFEDDINDLVRSMPIRRAEERPRTEIVWIPNALGFLALYIASLYTIYLFFFDSKWPTKAWSKCHCDSFPAAAPREAPLSAVVEKGIVDFLRFVWSNKTFVLMIVSAGWSLLRMANVPAIRQLLAGFRVLLVALMDG